MGYKVGTPSLATQESDYTECSMSLSETELEMQDRTVLLACHSVLN
jgi:hypothetical protein